MWHSQRYAILNPIITKVTLNAPTECFDNYVVIAALASFLIHDRGSKCRLSYAVPDLK